MLWPAPAVGKVVGQTRGTGEVHDALARLAQDGIVRHFPAEFLTGGEKHDVEIRAVVPIAGALGIHAVRLIEFPAGLDELHAAGEEVF